MGRNLVLTGEKAQLFEEILALEAQKYVKKRYSHLQYWEDLLQEMLIGIAKALVSADIEKNITSYAFEAGKWEVSKYLRSRFRLCRYADEIDIESSEYCNATYDNECEMLGELALEKAMLESFSKLKATEQKTLMTDIFDSTDNAVIKIDAEYHKKRRIVRKYVSKITTLTDRCADNKDSTGYINESGHTKLRPCIGERAG
jgi:DNA-directed RNA polymerase specialized sigma24 family protein